MPRKQTGKKKKIIICNRNIYKEGKDKSNDEHLKNWVKDHPQEAKHGMFVSGFNFFFSHCPDKMKIVCQSTASHRTQSKVDGMEYIRIKNNGIRLNRKNLNNHYSPFRMLEYTSER